MILKQYFSDFLYKSTCCWHSYELPLIVEAIQMSANNISFYKEIDKTYTGCNLKTTKLLDYELIGACAISR